MYVKTTILLGKYTQIVDLFKNFFLQEENCKWFQYRIERRATQLLKLYNWKGKMINWKIVQPSGNDCSRVASAFWLLIAIVNLLFHTIQFNYELGVLLIQYVFFM